MLNRRQMLLGSGAAIAGTAGLFNAHSVLADTEAPNNPYNLVVPTTLPYKHPDYATSSRAPVGIAIVCAVDISGSISSDRGEYQTQVQALGQAIASDDIRQAIFMPGGPGSAAICVVDYDDRSKLQLPWVDFREDRREKFVVIGQQIESLQRRSNGGTVHEAALQNAGLCFENLAPWEAENKSVNIMTDGTSSSTGLRAWRALMAERYGATIYALVTEGNNSTALNTWARNNLITPPNTYFKPNGRPLPAGFVHTVATERQTQTMVNTPGGLAGNSNFAAFNGQVRLAIRRQIILQTAGLNVETYRRFASLDELDNAENPYDFLMHDRRFAQLNLQRRNGLDAPSIEI